MPHNYFWEKIDNIVISNYPNIKIIDLSKKNYLASKSHPFGFSFSHYESDYYKDFLNELIKKLDSNKFKPIIMNTTRPMREGEVNGVDYNFTTAKEYLYPLHPPPDTSILNPRQSAAALRAAVAL